MIVNCIGNSSKRFSMKDVLLSAIHHLIYNNVWCRDSSDETSNAAAVKGYENRILGFRSEIEFERLQVNNRARVLQGGWLLSRQKDKRCLEDSVYFTISSDNPEQYIKLYALLERLNLTKRYFIKYTFTENPQEWQSSNLFDNQNYITFPSYSCFEFIDGKFLEVTNGDYGLAPLLQLYSKNIGPRYKATYQFKSAPLNFASKHLGDSSIEELQQILANRFIFDGLIGFTRTRGIPTDIDLVILRDDKLIFIEVKEKDKAKTVVGFGMDIPRLEDIINIAHRLGIEYYYVVKEVNNQTDRVFVGWWVIEIKDFYKVTNGGVIFEGGTGMATGMNSSHPTVVAPIHSFKKYAL